MGNVHIGKFMDYLDRRHDAGLDAGLYAALTPSGHGGSQAHGARATYVAMLYDIQVKPDAKGRLDRGVWTTKTKLAARSGYSEVTDHLAYLVKHGFAFEWRSPRQKARTAGYCVVDVEGEHAALIAWRDAAITKATAAISGDDDLLLPGDAGPEAVAQVDAAIRKAKEAFEADHPGHYATNGRILAMLEGRQLVIGTPRAQANDDKRRVKAEMAAHLAERGVADPKSVVAQYLKDRETRGEYCTTKALRRVLEAGALDRIATEALANSPIPEGPIVPEGSEPAAAAVELTDVVEDPPEWAFADEPVRYALTVAATPELSSVPASPRERAALRATVARAEFADSHRGAVLEVADAYGVGADDALTLVWGARGSWIDAHVDSVTGEEPAADAIDAVVPGIVRDLVAAALPAAA